MTQILYAILSALVVVIVPATARWLWMRFEAKLNENRDEVLQSVATVQTDVTALKGQVTTLGAEQIQHGKDIAFLMGAQAERTHIAQAATTVANLIDEVKK